jgi:hypothetical protein
MSEKAQEQPTEEPAPTKESDANRVTREEATGASRGPQEPSDEQADNDE